MFKYVLPAFILLLILIAFTGCKDDAPSPTAPGTYQLESPASLSIQFKYNVILKEYSANLKWNKSVGEDDENFTGYAVITYAADYGDSINPSYAVIDSAFLSGPLHNYTLASFEPNKRFFTRVYTVSFGNIFSAPQETEVYNTKEIAPPKIISMYMRFNNGAPEAVIYWSPSLDEEFKDFYGYTAITYVVSKEGEKGFPVGLSFLSKDEHSVIVKLDNKNMYLKTYVHATHVNNYLSPDAETYIYGYEILDSGKIEEMSAAPETKSAYGWNKSGAGSQYVFSSAKTDSMDICCVRKDGQLSLYSPSAIENAPAGARQTKFLKFGKDFWETVVSSPVELINDKVLISEGDIILLKNQDNYYIKLKIKSITPSGSNSYSTVAFDYRFQTVQGLRAAKQ